MNPRSYHTPVAPPSTRVRCPVCHEAVYSRAGIHPQCAVRLSDPPKPKAKPPVPASGADRPANGAERAGTELLADPPTAGAVAAPDRLPI